MNQYKKKKYEIGDVIGENISSIHEKSDYFPDNLFCIGSKKIYIKNAESFMQKSCTEEYKDKQIRIIGYSPIISSVIIAGFSFNNEIIGILELKYKS